MEWVLGKADYVTLREIMFCNGPCSMYGGNEWSGLVERFFRLRFEMLRHCGKAHTGLLIYLFFKFMFEGKAVSFMDRQRRIGYIAFSFDINSAI